MPDKDGLARGLEVMREVNGPMAQAMLERVGEISPEFGELLVKHVFGEVYTRPGLDYKQRQFATVAALAAMGNAQPQLMMHMNGALNSGCSRAEIVELMIHISVYAGFPAAMNGLFAAKELFAQRDAKGIKN